MPMIFMAGMPLKKAYDFIVNKCSDSRFAVLGYQLNNTLSDHGSVSRGVIAANDKK